MENNITCYETAFGKVELSPEIVLKYLTKGNCAISDEEAHLYIKLCQAQKINPYVSEAHLIKYSEKQPAQMVIGYDAYKRRAEENPNYLYRESGIIVCRNNNIVKKEGACLYPTEKLIGGWCRTYKLKHDREVTSYKEVTFDEYNKKNAQWNEKPCTMIEKVAVSQCLRDAFPTDYDGLYSADEMPDPLPQQNFEINNNDDQIITQSERQELFSKVHDKFGKVKGNDIIMKFIEDEGLQSTSQMTKRMLNKISSQIDSTNVIDIEEEKEKC